MEMYELLPLGWEKNEKYGFEGLWWFVNRTPAHMFYDFALVYGEAVISITCRDSLDEVLFPQLALKSLGHLEVTAPISIFANCLNHAKFDSIAVFPSQSHDKFRHDSSLLWEKTLVVCPISRIEFFGNEDPDEVKTIRRKFVSTIDWNREPRPILRMRYENPKTKSRSRGKERGLARLESLELELKNLLGVEGGFVEFEIFSGLVFSIRWDDGVFHLESSGSKAEFKNLDDILNAVREISYSGGNWIS